MRHLATALAAVLLAACASSKAAAPTASPAPAPVEMKSTGTPGQAAASQSATLTARITAIDAAKRAVTIQDETGATETFTAGPEVKRFAELAVGDTIRVELERGLLLEFQPAGSESVEPHAVAAGGRVGAAQPGGVVAAAVQGTVTVTAIDMGSRIVTIQGPGGKSYKVKAGRELQLDKLKVGDRLLATYAEAMAITLEKGGAKL